MTEEMFIELVLEPALGLMLLGAIVYFVGWRYRYSLWGKAMAAFSLILCSPMFLVVAIVFAQSAALIAGVPYESDFANSFCLLFMIGFVRYAVVPIMKSEATPAQ